MPATMKVAIARKLKAPLAIESVPIPEPGPGEVLVKVVACGVCHSDLHAIEGDWTPPPKLPLIPGHEVTGHVARLGAGVADLREGDRIGVPWMWSSCGTCEYCNNGMETICPRSESTGYSKPGGYAEYMIAPAAFCGRLPDHVDMVEIAPILCAGVTTYRGIKRTHARPGQWLAVVGIGGLGHIAVQYGRAMGMRVAAVDIASDKLELARSLGAEVLIDGREGDAAKTLQKQIGGAHGALIVAVAPQAFEQAIRMLRPAGTAVFIGLPGGDRDAIRLSIASVVYGERSLTGSNIGTRMDLAEAIDFASRGLVRSKVETAPLEDINAVLDRMRKGAINGRVVLKMA